MRGVSVVAMCGPLAVAVVVTVEVVMGVVGVACRRRGVPWWRGSRTTRSSAGEEKLALVLVPALVLVLAFVLVLALVFVRVMTATTPGPMPYVPLSLSLSLEKLIVGNDSGCYE